MISPKTRDLNSNQPHQMVDDSYLNLGIAFKGMTLSGSVSFTDFDSRLLRADREIRYDDIA